jgi:hypothetical protein
MIDFLILFGILQVINFISLLALRKSWNKWVCYIAGLGLGSTFVLSIISIWIIKQLQDEDTQ